MNFDTTPTFDKAAKSLAKLYHHFKIDLQKFMDEFDKNHLLATHIKGGVYKTRIANSDKAKGKSSGYRTYYYKITAEQVYLLIIYDKGEKDSLDKDELDNLLSEMIED